MNIENMTARKLEQKLEEILGSNEENYGDYYNDYSGLNGFYHTLAGTDLNYSEKTQEYDTSKVNGKVVINVPGLGNFTAIDKITEFMAESGDADSEVVFLYNGEHYRKQGYLDSYEGGYWDGRLEKVRPVEKTIIVWETA